MGTLFSALFAKIAAVLTWIGSLFVAIFVSVWDLVKDAFCWALDQFLSIAVSTLSAVDVSAFMGLGAWGAIPGEVLNIMALLGVGTAITIITAAIGIRFLLQLIPFVRLGS